MSTIAERVAKGVALLDEKDPGWWREDVQPAIDLAELEKRDGCRCVIGQRGDEEAEKFYTERSAELFGFTNELSEGVPYGFYSAHDRADPGAFDRDIDALNAEWRRVITERRTA